MFRIAICDDEPECQKITENLIKEYRDIQHIELEYTVYTNGSQLIDSKITFDLYLLDILMSGLGGIGLAKEIRQTNHTVPIIFLTSSPEFALEGYSVHALDYLLKPISKMKMFSALDLALSHRHEQVHDEIMIRSENKMKSVTIGSIEYIEARQDKMFLNLCSGNVIECVGTLATLEHQLANDPRFIKPHRSYLVNMSYIKELNGKDIQTSTCFPPIPIARGHYGEIKELYLEYMTNSMKRGKLL